MPKRYTVREILHRLDRAGWVQVAQAGSHRQFTHAEIPGRVTVAGKPSDTLHPKTAASIFRQADLDPDAP